MFKRLILGLIIVAMIVLVVYAVIWASRPNRTDVVLPRDESADRMPRAVRLGRPLGVAGSETLLIPVEYGTANEQSESYSNSYSRQPTVNVLFLAGDQATLLLDQPAHISAIVRPDSSDAQLRTWIAYELALQDTNEDGSLNFQDGRTLAVSALDGSGFRVILPAGTYLHGFHILDAERLLVTAFSEPPPGRGQPDPRRQVAFMYDVPSGALVPLESVDDMIGRASNILAN